MRPKSVTGVVALAIVLSFCLRGWAAPAPSDEQTAKAKLEALEKKLPDLLAKHIKDPTENAENVSDSGQNWLCSHKSTVKFLRMTGPSTAKLTVRLEYVTLDLAARKDRETRYEELLVIYLNYYDGVWTTQRFEATWTDNSVFKDNNRGAKFLMVALDELAAK